MGTEWESELWGIGLVGLAGGLGAVIGLEREFAEKPAGLRTHILVCAASALLMLVGQSVLDQFREKAADSAFQGDPLRIIQAIVIGISFLGAGTIIHQGGQYVEGLTTAASILLTAGIGIAVAVERLVFASGVTLLAIAVLFLFGWLERKLRSRSTSLDEGGGDHQP
jgi:putative Mg2+ transporter-C (MgtC) family protein